MHASIYLSIDCLALNKEEVRLTVSTAVCPRWVEGTDHQHTKGCRFLIAMYACMHLCIYLSLDYLALKKEEVRMAVRYRRMSEVDGRDRRPPIHVGMSLHEGHVCMHAYIYLSIYRLLGAQEGAGCTEGNPRYRRLTEADGKD